MALRLPHSILILLIIVSFPAFGQDSSPPRVPWVNYVSGEYDITPNISYATGNNTQLKLDLYEPRSRM